MTLSAVGRTYSGRILDDKDDLRCPVCVNLMTDAMIFNPCGHELCRTCDGKVTKCPMCRAPRRGATMIAFRTRGLIDKMQIVCRYAAEGKCDHVGTVQDIAAHESQCEYRPPEAEEKKEDVA